MDELGVMGATSGTELTPEGYLYTGFGELMFFIGPEQTPIKARIRTLEGGYLPVFSYEVEKTGIMYHFSVFAGSAVDGSSTPLVVNFVRITMTNTDRVRRAGFLTTAMRYQGEQTTDQPAGDNRFIGLIRKDRQLRSEP